MPNQNAIIVGGGIAGLTTAIALGQQGYGTVVLEQAEAFAPVGGGIQLGPNAFRMFERLGIESDILEHCCYPDVGLMRDIFTSEVITSLPMGDSMKHRYGKPYAVVHRGHLHEALLNACNRLDTVELKTASVLSSYVDRGDHVDINLASGDVLSGAALIGADGVWSTVRKQLVGSHCVPQDLGYFAYRAVCNANDIPADLLDNTVTLWAGPGFHMMHYPLQGGNLFNIVVVFRSGRFTRNEPQYGEPDELAEIFATAHPNVKHLLQFIDLTKHWSISVLEPVAQWCRGRVTLIGDAAHPMLQAMAQGACQAIEDSVCLADSVASSAGDFEKAFRATQEARQLRATQAQYQSRKYWEIYHAAGVYADLRKTLLKRSREEALESVAWVYDRVKC